MTDTADMTHLADLAGLVQVQPQATVSRTALRAEGTNVVLFAFDAGEELREHTAAIPVLLQTLEGSFRITADDRSVTLAPGDLIHLRTRVPHAVEALEPSKLALFLLTAD
ncbi:cupin domain-containing protein [Micropruina sonneratiae]|uniref:cupin domain-containing protein n=1 Tax=Micropruina sonneratiae TaxID=2986940 RepID=UPI0022276561|nr:cupin domain-containing protein [Micropruina sp. KQZ13P-5]